MVADRECLNPAFDKPRPDGSWQLTLTALELVDRLARFIPPPYRHLHRCIAIKVYSRRTPPRGRKWQRGQGRRSEKMDGGIIHLREKSTEVLAVWITPALGRQPPGVLAEIVRISAHADSHRRIRVFAGVAPTSWSAN